MSCLFKLLRGGFMKEFNIGKILEIWEIHHEIRETNAKYTY